MASTEIQLLKFIWETKGKVSWLRALKELRFFSPNYCRLICGSLIKKKFLEFSEGQYKVTGLGEEELMNLGLIEKVEKIAKPKKPKKPKKQIKVKEKAKEEIKKTPLTELSGLSSQLIEILKKEGLRALEDIATTSVVKLERIKGLTLGKAAKIINEAREKLKKKGKEYLWSP